MESTTNTTNVEIRRGDAVEVLMAMPEDEVDAIIMDPPYCAGGWTEAEKVGSAGMTKGGGKSGGWFGSDAMTTVGLSHLLRSVAVQGVRILRQGGSLLCFCDWRMVPSLAPALESAGLRWKGMVIWDKGSPGQGSTGFRPRHEVILWLVNGRTVRRGLPIKGNVIPCPRVHPSKRVHPTEKPVELLAQLMDAVVPEGGLVADPFGGSGATGEAALKTGRRAWLSDVDPRWVEVMETRLLNRSSPSRLLEPLNGHSRTR